MVVKKIVVTGGPCSGKTTALADLSDYFETIGWKVVIVGNVVAEAAADGIQRDDFGGTLAYEDYLFTRQINKEDTTDEFCKSLGYQKVLVVGNCGLLDVRACIGEKPFDDLLAKHHLAYEEILQRYDGVFHLETMVQQIGVNFEKKVLNGRSAQEAFFIDFYTQYAWEKHQHFYLIEASTSYKHKVEHLLSEVAGTLSEPFTYRLRHFLIDCPDTSNFDAAHGVRKSNISRLSYVSKCGEDTCIQHESRGNGYFSVFTKATKRHEPGANSFFITENRISPEDYFCILQGLPESRLSSETRYTIPRCNNQLLLDISIDDTAEDNSAILTVRMAPAMTDADFSSLVHIRKEMEDDPSHGFSFIKVPH